MLSIGVTASAFVLMGAEKGFAARVKRQNPAIQNTHCFTHREALMIKFLRQELSEKISDCIKILNLKSKQKP